MWTPYPGKVVPFKDKAMLDIQVDDKNPDGSHTINWERRAKVIVALAKHSGMSLPETLKGLGDNDKLKSLVQEAWK